MARIVRLVEDTAAASVSEAELSFEDKRRRVNDALAALYRPAGLPESDYWWGAYCVALYDDRVVFCAPDDKTYSAPYAVAETGAVTLGQATEVVVNYAPLGEAVEEAVQEAIGGLLEQAGKSGRAWDVLLIQAGTSLNGNHYAPEVLRKAAPLFEGVACYADHGSGRGGRSIKDKVGTFSRPEFGRHEIGGQVVEGVKARLTVVAPWLRETLLESVQAGLTDFIGFSIDAEGRVVAKEQSGRRVRFVEELTRVKSVDAVAEPSAGGRLVRLVAGNAPPAEEEETMTPEQLKAAIQEALAAGNAELAATLTASLATALKEALQPVAAGAAAAATTPVQENAGAATVATPTLDSIQEEIKALKEAEVRRALMALVEAKLGATALSDLGKQRVRTSFEELLERRNFEAAEVDARIQEDLAYEGALVQRDLKPLSIPQRAVVQMGDNPADKWEKQLHGFFLQENVDGVPAFRDLKEAFARWTGQDYLDVDPLELFNAFATRYDSHLHHKRVRESLTTASWGDVFADNLYVMMMRSYAASPAYDRWRPLVSQVENVPDFQTRHWVRIGGYGDLPTVAEQGTYQPLTSMSDEQVNYSIAKRGGLDDVTLEMLTYERGAQKVREIPRAMGRSAARTLFKYVMNIITTSNPTMGYDSVALYSAASGSRLETNTGTTALSVAGLNATQIAMRRFAAYNESLELLGERNKIKFLVVPPDLEMRAKRIVAPSPNYAYGLNTTGNTDADTSIDPLAFADRGIVPIVYDQLTDVTDWWAVADPTDMNTMVMGFWNGQQEPELFVQDNALIGAVFSADKITYKIRHVYAGAILDHRAFYRQVVAG
jgi:hypothetical protein